MKISGMHCATCAINIEKSLSRLDISKAQVNYGTDTAVVEFDPSKVSLADLSRAVNEAGYEVVNAEVVLKVGGMVCATCVQTIEAALKRLPGVTRMSRQPRDREGIRAVQPFIHEYRGHEGSHRGIRIPVHRGCRGDLCGQGRTGAGEGPE